MNNLQIAGLKWNEEGLIPAILQNAVNGDVLMMAWMNEEALRETLATGFACFWSRSRNELWRKGETSGNRQKLFELWVDCDKDTLLLKVKPEGPACHTGKPSCFFMKA